MLKYVAVVACSIALAGCSTTSSDQASPSAIAPGGSPPALPFGDMRVVGPLDLEKMPAAEFIPSPLELNAELAKLKLTGRTTIGFSISANGRPERIRVVNASDPRFGELASAYVRRFVFRPALRGGKAVPCEMEIPFSRD